MYAYAYTRMRVVGAFLISLLAVALLVPMSSGWYSGGGGDIRITTFTFDHYHSYSEVVSTLYAMAAAHPDIMNVSVIGYTYGWNDTTGAYDTPREILLVKISDNVNVDEDEPEIFIDGLHHAREWLALEVPLYIIQTLVLNYSVNDTIRWLVDHREIYIIPMVNPDGYVHDGNGDLNSASYWRKNTRDNDGDGIFEDNFWTTEGVDLNRNYGVHWDLAPSQDSDPDSDTYHGPAPFSEPETQAIRSVAENHTINLYITYHSYSSLILYPPGWTTDPSPWEYLFRSIGENMSKLQPYEQYTVQQSSDLYPAYGCADDWFYENESAIAFTIELEGNDFYPPTSAIQTAVENNIEAALYAIMVGDMSIRVGFPPKPYIIYGYAADPSQPVVAENLANGENVSVMPASNGFYMLNLGLLTSNYSTSDTIRVSNGAAYVDINTDYSWGKRVDIAPVPEFDPGMAVLIVLIVAALLSAGRRGTP